MDTNWCPACDRRNMSPALYCSETCRTNDLLRPQTRNPAQRYPSLRRYSVPAIVEMGRRLDGPPTAVNTAARRKSDFNGIRPLHTAQTSAVLDLPPQLVRLLNSKTIRSRETNSKINMDPSNSSNEPVNGKFPRNASNALADNDTLTHGTLHTTQRSVADKPSNINSSRQHNTWTSKQFDQDEAERCECSRDKAMRRTKVVYGFYCTGPTVDDKSEIALAN